jgi:hypothetical protein
MIDLHLLAVPVAAISSFALGALWFSPLFLGRVQEREMRKRGETAPQATARILAVSFLFTLLEAAGLWWFLGSNPGLGRAMTTGLVAGFCFAAAGTGINYQYTGRGLKLWLVDGGFHVARFLVYGIVLGGWK